MAEAAISVAATKCTEVVHAADCPGMESYSRDGNKCGIWDRSFQVDASTKRYFNLTEFKGNLSESMVKSLAARAEILDLTECNELRWTNLIPDLVHPREDGGMNDLIRLSLISWPAIQCLINTDGIESDATFFANLVELRLHDTHVRELCHGDLPNNFLNQLKKLELSHCVELDGALFKGKLELSNLKSVKLTDCSLTCVFHPSTTQSLKQLETLFIRGCSKLKCIISDDERSTEQNVDDHEDPNQKIHQSAFPKLKFLEVQGCHELELILPIFPCKELEKVKIHGCNKLKYIFGQCLKEAGPYQMEKEILLPLQEIEIANVPKFINIYPEYYLPQHSQVRKSWGPLCCLSSKASALSIDEPYFSKAIRLDHTQARKEKHLNIAGGFFTQPLIPYKNLRRMSIEGFSELKSLLTLSIASSLNVLEELIITKCGELEHIVTDEGHTYNNMNDCFVFSNLKQVGIFDAEKLKYLFGTCHSNQKHNGHIDLNLPNLKGLGLHNVPNMVSICTKNYSVKALSLKDICLENCPQLLVNNVMDLSFDVPKREEYLSKRKEKGRKEFTCLYITKASKAKSVPSPAHAYSPPALYQFNLREIVISGLSKLTSLFTISIASSLKLLETLKVVNCDTLEHIITDERPNGHSHLNLDSVFPNLKRIYVWSCNNLEYVFPAFFSEKFRDLGYVNIWKAEKMKYVFGYCHADRYHGFHHHKLNLPALKELYLDDAPNMVSICTENYYVEVLHLEEVSFEGCQYIPGSFIDFLAGGDKAPEHLLRRKASYFKRRGKPYPYLQDFPNSRDRFLRFENLSTLKFMGCKQLKFILSASDARSISGLKYLFISSCDKLVSIIKDDEENLKVPLDMHQAYFPMLSEIKVEHCKKLKCLFSISTCPKLPRLLTLNIEDAPKLIQVFECKQGAPQELVIKDVLPNLIGIRLVNLPSLHTIYQGIDFQIVKIRLVRDCNNIPIASVSSSEIHYFNAFFRRSSISQWADEKQRDEESEEACERGKTISEQNNSTPNQDNLKATFGESPSLERYDTAISSAYLKPIIEKPYTSTPSKESCGKESLSDQQTFGGTRSSNEAPQRVEKPSNEYSFKGISNKMALRIPPSISGMTTQRISSISSSKKPEIATSATHVELESGSSAVNNQSAKSQIMDVEHDLVRLFRNPDNERWF